MPVVLKVVALSVVNIEVSDDVDDVSTELFKSLERVVIHGARFFIKWLSLFLKSTKKLYSAVAKPVITAIMMSNPNPFIFNL